MKKIDDYELVDELKSKYDRLQVFLSSGGVNDIISVAEYFLDKCKSGQEDELTYNLFGFIIALRCIPDHLMHEYYVKYFGQIVKDHIELMIVEPDKLYADTIFKKKAYKTGHKVAIDFYEQWNNQMNIFKKDEDMGFLFDMRDITIHRKVATRPHFIFVSKEEKRFGFEKRDHEDRRYYNDPISLCTSCLEQMKQFIRDMKSKF